MKQLITALSIVLVIAACKSNPTDSKPEFEPYEVGAWLMTSPTSADYIGIQESNKLKSATSDTIEIKQPGQRSLELWREADQNPSQFKMEFIDSTISKQSVGGTLDPVYSNPAGEGGYPIGASGYHISMNDDRVLSRFTMSTTCDHNFDSNKPIMHISFYYLDTDDLYRVYAIHVDGMIDAVNDIVCN